MPSPLRRAWLLALGMKSQPRAERERLLAILRLPPEEAAPLLLGQVLVRRRGRRVLLARIVETEAYLGEGDPAAHVFRGRTRRNAPLFGPPGTIYVYLVYGLHHCLNLAVDAEGRPGCVLIRAAEPLGWSERTPRALSGPGLLCRMLGLTTELSGRHLFEARPALTLRAGPKPARIEVSRRVGIRHAANRSLRFFDAGSRAVSRARGTGRRWRS